MGVDKASGDTHDAFFILGSFCVEQMRIGYKIEYLLQREAERIALAQQKKRDALQQGYTVSGKKVTWLFIVQRLIKPILLHIRYREMCIIIDDITFVCQIVKSNLLKIRFQQ